MIYFLDDSKVIIECNGETYEYIKNTRLAKLMCEKFMLCEGINYYYDKISYVIDTEYVYYDIKTDNIYIWSNLDKNKNISENIIWYVWKNEDFVEIKGDKYDNINNAYIYGKLVLLKDVLIEYNNIKKEETSSDDISETSSEDLSLDDTSESDFTVDTSSDDLSETNDTIIDNMNIDYMSVDNVEYRKEYVSNLINIVNSTQNIDNERLSIMLNYYNHYYST